MPKIKQPNPHPLTELLKSKDLRGSQLARILDTCQYTAKKRLDDPSLLTIRDLRRLARSGKLPIEKVRECVAQEISWTMF